MDKDKTKNTNSTPTFQKIVCRQCKQITNHLILHTTDTEGSIGKDDIWWEYTYKTLQCQGCETVCLLEEYFCSEDIDPYTGQPELHSTIYPSPFKNKAEMQETYYLPEKVKKAYEETISAFNTNLRILAGVGLRIIIEAICKDKITKEGSLANKIDGLVKIGLMTKQQAELLHLNRFIGNVSVHEIIEIPEEELKIGLDIIETTLRNAYILPKQTALLQRKYNKK